MSLTDIANDFTKPAAWTNEDDMAAILGAIFCKSQLKTIH